MRSSHLWTLIVLLLPFQFGCLFSFLSFLLAFNCSGENFQCNIEQKWWEGSLSVYIHVLSFTMENKERTSKRPQAIQKSWKVIGKETEKAKILFYHGTEKNVSLWLLLNMNICLINPIYLCSLLYMSYIYIY